MTLRAWGKWILGAVIFLGLVAVQAFTSSEFKLIELREVCLCSGMQESRE